MMHGTQLSEVSSEMRSVTTRKQRRTVTVNQCVALLQMSQRSVHAMVRDGRLERVPDIGRKILIYIDSPLFKHWARVLQGLVEISR